MWTLDNIRDRADDLYDRRDWHWLDDLLWELDDIEDGDASRDLRYEIQDAINDIIENW